ncbi:cell surface glycoprotein 1-like [Limanda limanda]|uniref:cell surface glycoprotein 1-like n=1 Tax=Limanda limanda TaxID=27771 RepID=UPI0029C92F66|nr:cell surface glycoprotein 1-like [Limanda limanda]
MDEEGNPLERDHSLHVVLPGGQEKNAMVHGSKPVMDLLVTLCASYHLNPTDYTVEVVSTNKNNISFTPNSPIGSLEAERIVLKPRGTEGKIRKPYTPEATVRLLINYNRAHKAVVRVNPRVPLELLLPLVCDKCEFQVDTTVLLRDSQSTEPLDLTKSLDAHGLREVFAKDSAAKEPADRPKTPAAEIISPPSLQELPKEESRQKENPGFLSLFRRKKKTPELDGAASVPASPAANKPMALSMNVQDASSSSTADTPKKRRAPQPPMSVSLSVPNNLSTCHVRAPQMSADSTLRRTKRRAPPPPCANSHQEQPADTQLTGPVDPPNTLEELRESDESDSLDLSRSSSPSPTSSRTLPSSSSSRPSFERCLPSFRGKDFSEARSALAKVLSSSVSKGTLVKHWRKSASLPKIHRSSSFLTPRFTDNGHFRFELESVLKSRFPTEPQWEDPLQRKGMTTFKVIPLNKHKSHEPETPPDVPDQHQVMVENDPEGQAPPEAENYQCEHEDDSYSPQGSDTGTPLKRQEFSFQEASVSLECPPPAQEPSEAPDSPPPAQEASEAPDSPPPDKEPSEDPDSPPPAQEPSDAPDSPPPAQEPSDAPDSPPPAQEPSDAPDSSSPSQEPSEAPDSPPPAQEPSDTPDSPPPSQEPSEAPDTPPPDKEPSEAPDSPPPAQEPSDTPDSPPPDQEPSEAPDTPPPDKEPSEAPDSPPPDQEPSDAPDSPSQEASDAPDSPPPSQEWPEAPDCPPPALEPPGAPDSPSQEVSNAPDSPPPAQEASDPPDSPPPAQEPSDVPDSPSKEASEAPDSPPRSQEWPDAPDFPSQDPAGGPDSPPPDQEASYAPDTPPPDQEASNAPDTPPPDQEALNAPYSPPPDQEVSDAPDPPPPDQEASNAPDSPPPDQEASNAPDTPPPDQEASNAPDTPPPDQEASDAPDSPPLPPDLDDQKRTVSPLSEVEGNDERSTQGEEEEPEVLSEVTAATESNKLASDCQITSDYKSVDLQNPGGGSVSVDVDQWVSCTEETEEEDVFPPPPPPVFFNEDLDVPEEEREDAITSSPSQPSSPACDRETNAFSQVKALGAPEPSDKMSAAPSRFAQAVALAVQRSHLQSHRKALDSQDPSGQHTVQYQYGKSFTYK